MKASHLRLLGRQADALFVSAPDKDAPQPGRAEWANKAKSFAARLDRARKQHLDELIELDEGPVLDDALSRIGGAESMHSGQDISRCLTGFATIAKLLPTIARRVRDGKGIAEMLGDFLREAGVLVCVFGVLDKVLQSKPVAAGWFAAVLGLGLILAVIGGIIESRRQ